MTVNLVKAPGVGARIRNAVTAFNAAKAKMAEDACRASDATNVVICVPSDGQPDSAIAVRTPRELERWLKVVEARLGHLSQARAVQLGDVSMQPQKETAAFAPVSAGENPSRARASLPRKPAAGSAWPNEAEL
jgi:hypothetical protein